jgi:SAM-dependent methyltransferase
MEAVERLSLEEVGSGSLLAAEHLHRYELAAELCRGLRVADVCCGSGYGSRILKDRGARAVRGVDNDAGTIEEAQATLAAPPELEFELADAAEFLERDLPGDFDAVVMFEGLEHIADPERALAALRHHAARGLRCAVSVPNSRALAERNPFHVTEYGYTEALAALRSLGDGVFVLHQYVADGSLIRSEEASELDGRIVLEQRGEPDLCNHFIGLVNFDPAALERSGSARIQLEVAPLNRRYMLELERKVDQLWSELKEAERRHDAELHAVRSSLSWRMTEPLRAAKRVLSRPGRRDAGVS